MWDLIYEAYVGPTFLLKLKFVKGQKFTQGGQFKDDCDLYLKVCSCSSWNVKDLIASLVCAVFHFLYIRFAVSHGLKLTLRSLIDTLAA